MESNQKNNNKERKQRTRLEGVEQLFESVELDDLRSDLLSLIE